LTVEWVSGAAPTAFLYDADNNVVSEHVVGDKDMAELLQFLKEKDFVPSRKKPAFGAPVATVAFGGHFYELFDTGTYFESAQEWAESRSHNGSPGYLVTISSKTRE